MHLTFRKGDVPTPLILELGDIAGKVYPLTGCGVRWDMKLGDTTVVGRTLTIANGPTGEVTWNFLVGELDTTGVFDNDLVVASVGGTYTDSFLNFAWITVVK